MMNERLLDTDNKNNHSKINEDMFLVITLFEFGVGRDAE
jgi:hypothetical protein